MNFIKYFFRTCTFYVKDLIYYLKEFVRTLFILFTYLVYLLIKRRARCHMMFYVADDKYEVKDSSR